MTEGLPHAGLVLAVGMAFALVHIASPWLRWLDRTPRSIWLSAAGGVSVAYVFVHLLPELAHLNEKTAGEDPMLYLGAMAGFTLFYGLERLIRRRAAHDAREASPPGVFWLHLGSFAVYNALIGYLLDEQARQEDLTGLLLYGAAMALHFVVNDRSLYAHHGRRYLTRGRWILAGAALAGVGLGFAVEVPQIVLSACFAVLAGSVVLNVIKEELPEERASRFWAFAAAGGLYAVLLTFL